MQQTLSRSHPVLEVEGLNQWFGGLKALHDVNLKLNESEVVALVGDNGAGKSTLLNILAGNRQPSNGSILVDGSRVNFIRPIDATQAGIATVYQDLSLALDLNTIENIFLGREIQVNDRPRKWFGHLNKGLMEQKAREALERVQIRIPDIHTPCSNLSGGQRQAVAIARAVMWCDRVLLLDEPTAALGVEQQREVLDLITHVRDHLGVSVILVSHQLPHVLEVADRIVVLRQGSIVKEFEKDGTTSEELIAAITGLDSEREDK